MPTETPQIPELVFKVQGSSDEPYTVTIKRRSPENLSAYCTCAAADNGMACKHRIRILSGDVIDIVSGNESEVAKAVEWVKGTDIEHAMKELSDFEKVIADANVKLKRYKMALAKALID